MASQTEEKQTKKQTQMIAGKHQQNRHLMGFFLIFDYIVAFFVLIATHAPWWAWLIYVGGALIWFVIGALSDRESSEKPEESKF